MTQRILRYSLDGPDVALRVLRGARVLSAQEKRGSVSVWIQCDANTEALAQLRVLCRPTGVEFDSEPGERFVNTVQVGEMVWHVYVVGEEG